MTEQANDDVLTNSGSSDTMSAGGNTDGNVTGAGPSGPEDTLEGLKAVIAQQKDVIDVLTAQVGTFKEQWETAIRQGAAIGNVNAGKPNTSSDGQSATGTAQEDYVYLKDMDFRLTKEDLLK